MTVKELTCVVCPNGCSVTAEYTDESPHTILSISGHRCPRGEVWAKQEIESPMRTFSTSVTVRGGNFLEASERTVKPIPLDKIFDVMAEIRKITLDAPVSIGDIILENPSGTDTKVIVTRNVEVKR